MESKLICDTCKIKFSSKLALNNHKNKKNSCLNDVCDELINKIANITSTLNRIDDNSYYSNKFICNYCEQKYSNKSNLKKHMLTNCEKKIGRAHV